MDGVNHGLNSPPSDPANGPSNGSQNGQSLPQPVTNYFPLPPPQNYHAPNLIFPPPSQASLAAMLAIHRHRHQNSSVPASAPAASSQHQEASTYSAPSSVPNEGRELGTPTSDKPPSDKCFDKRLPKYNHFNIFFMLERQLLLRARGGGIDAIKNPIDTSDSFLARYQKELHLPPLCRRYSHLPLTSNWFLELTHHRNKKRKHQKAHGLVPFKELAQTVAKNYREIDDDTKAFVTEVARRVGWHLKVCEEQKVKSSGVGPLGQDQAATAVRPIEMKVHKAPYHSSNTVPGRPSAFSTRTSQSPHLLASRSPSNTPPVDSERERLHLERARLPGRPPSAHAPTSRTTNQQPASCVSEERADPELELLQIELRGALNARCDLEKRILLLKDKITHRVEFLKEKIAASRARRNAQAVATQGRRQQLPANSSAAISRALLQNLPEGKRNQLIASLFGGVTRRPHPPAVTERSFPQAKTDSEYSAPAPKTTGPSHAAVLASPSAVRNIERTLLEEALTQIAPIIVSGGAVPTTLLQGLSQASLESKNAAVALSALASLMPPMAPPDGAEYSRDEEPPRKKRPRSNSEELGDDVAVEHRRSEEDDREELAQDRTASQESESVRVPTRPAAVNATANDHSVTLDPELCKGLTPKFINATPQPSPAPPRAASTRAAAQAPHSRASTATASTTRDPVALSERMKGDLAPMAASNPQPQPVYSSPMTMTESPPPPF